MIYYTLFLFFSILRTFYAYFCMCSIIIIFCFLFFFLFCYFFKSNQKAFYDPKSLEIYCSGSWWALSLIIFSLTQLQDLLIWQHPTGYNTSCCSACMLLPEYMNIFTYVYFKDFSCPFSIAVLCQTVFNT